MKKLLLLIFVAPVLLWGLGANPSGAVDNAIQNLIAIRYNSLYVTNKDSLADRAIYDKNTQRQLLNLCRKSGNPINTIYLEVSALEVQNTELKNLIRSLHNNKIKAIYLCNDQETLADRERFRQLVDSVTSFNANSEDKFDGIHLYPAAYSAEILAVLIPELEDTKLSIAQNRQEMDIGLTIPWTLFGTNNDLFLRIFNYVNYVNIAPLSADYLEIKPRLAPLMAYAQEINTPINIDIPLAEDTADSFFGSEEYLRRSLQLLAAETGSAKVFRGFALAEGTSLINIYSLPKPITPTDNIRLSRTTTLTITDNYRSATLNISQDQQYILLDIWIDNFIPGGISENIANIKVSMESQPNLSLMKHLELSWKYIPDKGERNIKTIPCKPATPNLAEAWTLSTRLGTVVHILTRIPRSELFFDPKDTNYFWFSFTLDDVVENKVMVRS